MFAKSIPVYSEDEVVFVEKSAISDHIFDDMDRDIDSIMHVIDNKAD